MSLQCLNDYDYTVWYGNPAKLQGYITKNGIILSLDLKDKNGNKYQLKNSEPISL